MKAEILKLAGVKNEKEFYKKFPTEQSFMAKYGKQIAKIRKAAVGDLISDDTPNEQFNPMYYSDAIQRVKGLQTGINPQEQKRQEELAALSKPDKSNGIFDILAQNAPQIAQAATMLAGAKNGKKLRKAQDGIPLDVLNMDMENYIPQDSVNTSSTGFDLNMFENKPKGLSESLTPIGGMNNDSDALSSMLKGLPGGIGPIVGNIQEIRAQNKQRKKDKQYAKISGLVAQASAAPMQRQTRRYVRPEDSLIDPINPTGSGTNYLAAENGIEVQNTYAPNVLYTDLGYEPLNDSNKVKAYKKGGKLEKAQLGEALAPLSGLGGQLGGLAASAVQGGKGVGPGSKLGSTIGGIAGNLIPIPGLGPLIGSTVGGFLGGVIGGDGKRQREIEEAQNQIESNTLSTAFSQLGNQNKAYMRSGGHLKNYTAPSEYAMETGRAQLAMGGDLAVYRGEAETISDNPYTGETVMFRGPSHDDGGMPIKYGGNPVEVEGGEPAMVMQDGGKQDNLVVFGNMNIPDYAANEIGDKKAKGMKFKNYVAKLSKEESKQNKVSEKGITMINDSNPGDKFDQLAMNTGMAMLEGSNMKLKSLANKKNNAAAVQSAILDTAEEMGMDSAELSKRNVAKFGGKFTSAPIAQDGIIIPVPWKDRVGGITLNRPLEDQYPLTEDQMIKTTDLQDVKVFPTKLEQLRNKIRNEVADIKKNKTSNSDWMTAATIASQSLSPFLNKVRNPLDPAQLAPEMYALATNQMQPVQMQQYQPILTQPISISLQDQLNEIDAQARAAYKMSGQNPAAAAQIAAQSAQAKTKVLGEEFRLNQAEKLRAQQANAATLNDAMLKNLALMDQQYVRQATAESKTKAQTFEALKSIADKTAQNKLETKQLQTAQNMYPAFRFTNEGVAYKDPTYLASLNQYGSREVNNRFPAPPTGTSVKDYTLDKDTRQWIPKTASVEAKNGSIVKSLKNF